MNRADRRKAKKAPAPHKLTKQEMIDKLVRNGITLEDLKKEYNNGFSDGYDVAGSDMVKACYAAICLALHEIHGFGQKRCIDVLKAVDNIILNRLTGEELIEEVLKQTGARIDFNECFDRVKEVEE